MPVKDETGNVYGRLRVIGPAKSNSCGQARWLCECDCGAKKEVIGSFLRRGLTTSCGCYCRERTSQTSTKHGASRPGSVTLEYRIWNEMRQRCTNPKCNRYYSHGARGISVCERWNDFSAFMEDMGPRPSIAHSLDRINNDGNYEPSNCRWATRKEQARNKRRTLFVELRGVRKPLVQWCEELGVRYRAAWQRIKEGKSPEVALKAA